MGSGLDNHRNESESWNGSSGLAVEAAGGPMADAAPASVRDAAAKGFLWTGGQALAMRGVSLVGFILLAHLLTPRDFGIAALAAVFALLLQMISVGGFSAALVQRESIDALDLDTAFWMTVMVGIALALTLAATASLLADALGEPALGPVLRVLSISFVFVGLSSTHGAVIQRRLDFRLIALPTIGSSVISMGLAVAMAIAGFGYWSLVAQAVCASVLTAIGLFAVSGFRPRLRFSMERLRNLLGDSLRFLGTSLTVLLNQRTDDFLVGGFLGSAQLGIYAVAYRLVSVLVEVITLGIRTVAFPVMSRLQSQPERLSNVYLISTRMSAVLTMPLFVFGIVEADQIIESIFGAKWSAGADTMRVLCVFGLIQALDQLTLTLLQAIGRIGTVFRLATAGTALQIASFLAVVNLGLVWVAAAIVLRAYVVMPVALWIASRALPIRPSTVLASFLRPLVASAVMVGLLLVVGPALPGRLGLVAETALGLGAYLAVMRVIARRELAEAADFLLATVQRRDSAVALEPEAERDAESVGAEAGAATP